MDIASKSIHSSIMARIAKVRERMLIELATGIPASSKTLFLPLCQHYEQQDEGKSFLSSYENTHRPDQDVFPTHVMQGDDRQRRYESELRHKDFNNFAGWDDGYSDWPKADDSPFLHLPTRS